MHIVIAVAFALLIVTARSAEAVCCQCEGATVGPASDFCSGDASRCIFGATELECLQRGGVFSEGAPGTVCNDSIGQCGASPAPALSTSALVALIAGLSVAGAVRIRGRRSS